MENYKLEIFLYLPILLTISALLLDRYLFKDKDATIGDIFSVLFVMFIPIINIIVFAVGFINSLMKSGILDKKIWK